MRLDYLPLNGPWIVIRMPKAEEAGRSGGRRPGHPASLHPFEPRGQ
jgi:hypothetical protein